MTGTAYNSYLRTDVLHSLQQDVTDDEGERSFIVICQIQELYWALITHDLTHASTHLRGGEVRSAVVTLRRAASHFDGLAASWRSLTWMLPSDFRAIKIGMTNIHGKSSSLQSWKYRELLFRMGLKDKSLTAVVESMPSQHADLLHAYNSPSIYQDALAAAADAGYEVERVRPHAGRDSDGEVDLDAARFWTHVFNSTSERDALFADLGRALLALDEGLQTYRQLHYAATVRTIGSGPGFFGTSGAKWLEPTLVQKAFPDLWHTEARNG